MTGRHEIPYALIARGIQGSVMLGAAVIMIWRVPAAAQGFLWVFMSLGALQQAGDCGLTQVVLQTANFHAARGDAGALAGFWRLAKRIAAATIPAAALIAYLAGMFFFDAAGDAAATPWHASWAAFVCGTMTAQLLFLGVAYIEGAVSVTASWRFQACLEGISGFAFLLGLWSGAGLWSAVLYAAVRTTVTAAWLASKRRHFGRALPAEYGLADWRREVWPYQWKVALNAFTGILIFRAMTPVVLAEHGAAAAGRFGFSLALMNTWLSLTAVWPLSQTVRLGTALNRENLAEVRRIFRATLAGSTVFAVAGAAAALAALWAIETASPGFASAYAGLEATGFLLAAAVGHHLLFCIAVLLRSERRDPLLPFSIGGSLFTLGVVWLAAHIGTIANVAAAYFVCTCIGLALVLATFHAQLRRALG
ncbi:MAG TPA: hypothetical protein VKS43_16035 [Burkholderiales bacterium]|nr:hypothetical protein [Burkholderiales bacterium]